MKILVGVDGSESSQRAVGWCAEHAPALDASVVAVYALQMPVYALLPDAYAPPVYADVDRENLREELRERWCSRLNAANVPFDAKVIEGYPADVIIETARREQADLVVIGRRGLGGFKKMLLGSTSHQLAQHLDRTLVIVP
ncbi:MAG TPA: universal stress protein [Acidimicrobiia bacterium]|jgi:nucleotide-binding universal stress UspA family protein|nr:universal stress protein [Acidimicrobiia bacterium]